MIPLNDILKELRAAPRLSGTPACDVIARRLAGRFEDIGYNPEIQEYTFIGWRVPEPPIVTNLDTGRELPARAVTWCGGIEGVDVEGVIAPRGKMNSWGLGTVREYGRWAIVDNDIDHRNVYLIEDTGAHLVLPYPMEDVAYICLAQSDLKHLADTSARVRVSTRTELSFGAKGLNVVATKQGRSSDEIIIGAHHDTVYDDENGLHDNGGGCATLLLLAELLRDIDTHHTIRFLSTGGEEFNLVGARSYIRQREEEESLRHVKASITLDYITQPPEVVFVRCTEDFDPIINRVLDAHRGKEYGYDLEDGIYRDLGCIDGRAFEEKGISSIYFAPTGYPQRHDEDNESIARNLRTNAMFVRDLIIRTDQEMGFQQ